MLLNDFLSRLTWTLKQTVAYAALLLSCGAAGSVMALYNFISSQLAASLPAYTHCYWDDKLLLLLPLLLHTAAR
jgi:hypothetical protein